MLVHYTDDNMLIRPGDHEVVKEDAFEMHMHA